MVKLHDPRSTPERSQVPTFLGSEGISRPYFILREVKAQRKRALGAHRQDERTEYATTC